MLSTCKEQLRKWDYYVFRCVIIDSKIALGVIEGIPGLYAKCQPQAHNTPPELLETLSQKQIFNMDRKWKMEPYTGFEEGQRYVIKMISGIGKDILTATVCAHIPDAPFTFPNVSDGIMDDPVVTVIQEYHLSDEDALRLKVYKKAFGLRYRCNAWDFSVQTNRSSWRYDQKGELHHESSNRNCTDNLAMAHYLKGWHLQKINDTLDGIMDALVYIINHDYGIHSVSQQGARRIF